MGFIFIACMQAVPHSIAVSSVWLGDKDSNLFILSNEHATSDH